MIRHLLKIKKAAKILKVNEMTIRAQIKKGRIKTIQKGRFLYLSQEAAFNYSLKQKFYTIERVASLFKVSHITVRKLLKTKRIKSLKVGALYRIPEQEILKFTNQKKVKPLLDIKNLQKELEISRLTAIKLIASGRIAAFKIGRLHRIAQEAFLTYLKQAKRKVYSVSEAARVLKVSTALVRRLIANGQIKSEKIGRSYLITEMALFVFLKRNQEIS